MVEEPKRLKERDFIMRIIVCVDDKGGVMFNHRRQSQDRVLREEILKMTAGKTLWMSSYSAKMFEFRQGITAAEDFLNRATSGDFCFIEDTVSISEHADSIEEIILFKWNRAYPADVYFTFPDNHVYKMVESREFAGFSHEKITQEVYVP